MGEHSRVFSGGSKGHKALSKENISSCILESSRLLFWIMKKLRTIKPEPFMSHHALHGFVLNHEGIKEN